MFRGEIVFRRRRRLFSEKMKRETHLQRQRYLPSRARASAALSANNLGQEYRRLCVRSDPLSYWFFYIFTSVSYLFAWYLTKPPRACVAHHARGVIFNWCQAPPVRHPAKTASTSIILYARGKLGLSPLMYRTLRTVPTCTVHTLPIRIHV